MFAETGGCWHKEDAKWCKGARGLMIVMRHKTRRHLTMQYCDTARKALLSHACMRRSAAPHCRAQAPPFVQELARGAGGSAASGDCLVGGRCASAEVGDFLSP